MNHTRKAVLRFVLKAVLMTLPVVVPAVAFYIVADPFMTLSSRQDWFSDDPQNMPKVGVNKGMVTVRNYEQRLREGACYNAFIFGSSISCYYDAAEWARLLALNGGCDTVDISPIHFDSSAESIVQMAEKVSYLDRTGAPLDYALIILDPFVMAAEHDDSPMSITPPPFSTNPLQPLKFHYTFFRAATNSDFLKSWLPAKITGHPCAYGHKYVFERQPIVYDSKYNQESIPSWDKLIATDPEAFYAEHPLMESPDDITQSEPVLDHQTITALERIADVFARHNTDYRIIIGPNRRKITLNPDDHSRLVNIFDVDRINDFSLSNVDDLTADTLLYDGVHYRPVYANRLLHKAYESR